MKIKMEYKIGHRKVSQREWERHLTQAPLEAAKDAIRQQVRRIRCPRHGTTATVTFTKTARGFNTQLRGCCDELIGLVNRSRR